MDINERGGNISPDAAKVQADVNKILHATERANQEKMIALTAHDFYRKLDVGHKEIPDNTFDTIDNAPAIASRALYEGYGPDKIFEVMFYKSRSIAVTSLFKSKKIIIENYESAKERYFKVLKKVKQRSSTLYTARAAHEIDEEEEEANLKLEKISKCTNISGEITDECKASSVEQFHDAVASAIDGLDQFKKCTIEFEILAENHQKFIDDKTRLFLQWTAIFVAILLSGSSAAISAMSLKINIDKAKEDKNTTMKYSASCSIASNKTTKTLSNFECTVNKTQ